MTPEAIAELLAQDQRHVWHPYASMSAPPPAYPVVAASGVHLQLADGRELLDGMSSWWSAIHGYNHPVLNQAAGEQLQAMAHVMLGGITHPQVVKLCSTLARITPAGLDKVFMCDSGSVAVEVAIKMALQYWVSQGNTKKHRLLTVRSGYHGDTFAAMSVCDPVTGMHHLFSDVLMQQIFVPAPVSSFGEPMLAGELDAMRTALQANSDSIAAVIIEPIVQGTGGMRFYSADYLAGLRALCDEFDVLLICDEIATGFGRTGKLFACEHAGIAPDIMCLGKTLTGGYLSLAATLCNERVSDGICDGDAGVLMHGPTFMGNPLACAIANASIDLLLQQDWQSRIDSIRARLCAGLAPARNCEGVADVRVLGAIGVIETTNDVDVVKIQKTLVARGVWVRPFGKLVYVMPPYVMDASQVDDLCAALVATIQEGTFQADH